ncbi:Cys/Met metabolism pyridoxal-phosphate-dependent protein [Anaeromyxobacter sp. K]|uniref:trans-sulfuration enzyme family protein n=1 Tax=Anaeromyxobacter sp. (strain K) TaxID=447217 RepID=UPI00015F8884|nr:PLP-dependent aspartate aminotransferase family protein [Anaeromyxobacter sp. K]ACG73022.1 Cys/Met metabolism pyridoxal-phosphate-dependent protein [Anaeromyxobacter sp. K]
MADPLRPETLALHADAGLEPSPDVAPPIHLSTTFDADNPEGLVYSRDEQPTRRRLEAVLGALEGGGTAVVYASGLAAVTAALLHLQPRRVAIARGGYHGTHAAIDALARLGVEKVALDAPVGKGDLVWLETPRNPTCEVQDVAAHAARARAAGALLVVDGTFATPALQQPLALGADLVMHSLTKFLSGHSDALGGVLVARDPALGAALRRGRTVGGAVLGALETWLVLRGVRTLGVRVRAQSATATRLAEFLAPRVARVWHPSRPDFPGRELAARQMRGPGPMLAFELGSEAEARALPGKLRLFRDATSLGGVESLVEWRRKVDPEAPPALLRVSAGLEDPDDLVADLEQGLRAVAAG